MKETMTEGVEYTLEFKVTEEKNCTGAVSGV